MTGSQSKQIAECKHLIAQGETIPGLRNAGYAERAIMIAYGRDPENMDPYGAQNHPITVCSCRSCAERRDAAREATGDVLGMEIGSRMFGCAQCGNKRCPHATYHGHACTNSNEPAQSGSVYA